MNISYELRGKTERNIFHKDGRGNPQGNLYIEDRKRFTQ